MQVRKVSNFVAKLCSSHNLRVFITIKMQTIGNIIIEL